MSKILQIIPAPENLVAEYIYRPDREEFTPEEEPDRNEYKQAVCMALVEQDNGDTSVMPMVVEDESHGIHGFGIMAKDNIKLAEDYSPDMAGYGWYEFQGTVWWSSGYNQTIVTQQDKTGFAVIPRGNPCVVKVRPPVNSDDSKGVKVVCTANGIEQTLGIYNSELAAKLAYNKLWDNLWNAEYFQMPSSESIDKEIYEDQRIKFRREAQKKDSEMHKAFSKKTADRLIRGEFYTPEEIKTATEDELIDSMRHRGITPKCRNEVISELKEKGYLSDNA